MTKYTDDFAKAILGEDYAAFNAFDEGINFNDDDPAADVSDMPDEAAMDWSTPDGEFPEIPYTEEDEAKFEAGREAVVDATDLDWQELYEMDPDAFMPNDEFDYTMANDEFTEDLDSDDDGLWCVCWEDENNELDDSKLPVDMPKDICVEWAKRWNDSELAGRYGRVKALAQYELDDN